MTTREQRVLELVIPRLMADGYDVYTAPPRSMLPPFMDGFRPDAIALGEPKNLAIEVIARPKPEAEQRVSNVARFDAAPDWELRVYYAPQPSAADDLPATPLPVIASALKAVEGLKSEGRLDAALLMAWATLESLGRRINPERLSRPQPAEHLLERLASDGTVTPSEAMHLRKLADLRNRLIHGELDIVVSTDDISELLEICETLMSLDRPVPGSP